MITIGLVGPTNAGKSCLFNFLLGSHRAIVTDIPGTTRELLRDQFAIGRTQMDIVDSPGLLNFSDERPFLQQIIADADILLFVVDGKQEIGMKEQDIHQMICHAGKRQRTILVVNKLDGKVYTDAREGLLAPWYEFGYDITLPTSMEQYEGGDLLREELMSMVKRFGPQSSETPTDEQDAIIEDNDDDVDHTKKPLAVAFIGRPNAGKSTLLNKLAGEEIATVSATPGTTLDYLRGSLVRKGRHIDLYDTAGMKKRGKTLGLERIAYAKTKTLLEYMHPITVVLLDIDEGLTKRDASIVQEFSEISGPLILAVNKIDLFPPEDAAYKIKQLKQVVKIPSWIPIIPLSGKQAIGLPKLMQMVLAVEKERYRRVPTAELNSVVTRAWLTKPPRFPKNKICKWKYITQVKTAPPTFMVSVNDKSYANFSFVSWMEKVIREAFGFQGCPIRLEFRQKKDENPYADRYER